MVFLFFCIIRAFPVLSVAKKWLFFMGTTKKGVNLVNCTIKVGFLFMVISYRVRVNRDGEIGF